MKIIQAHKFYYLKGGPERYILELSQWLESHGHQVIPFAMEHTENLESPYRSFFPRHIRTDRRASKWQKMRTVGRMMYSRQAKTNMRNLISKVTPDLCHIHNIYTQLSPSILASLRAQEVPVIMTVHDHHLVSPQYNIWAPGCGEDYRQVSLWGAFTSKFHKHSSLASVVQTASFKFHRALGVYRNNIDVYICPSKYMKRQLLKAGFDEKKIRVVNYGIDTSVYQSRFDHEGYLLFVGRLSEEKGVETIIRAADILEDIPLKIVGRGPQSDWLHKLAHGSKNIEFVGFRSGDELAQLYRGAAAVLLPSRVHENFPLVAIEAMAYGKPVIASNVGGIPEIIQDRQTGYLVEPIDIDGWTEAMLRVYHDEQARDAMARESRARIEQSFTWTRHVEQIMSIYRSVLSH